MKTSNYANQVLVEKVVEKIFHVSFGMNEGMLPRCGEPCPRCKCPCIKAFDHISGSDNRHDTFHQPSGLVGCHWDKTLELSESSCVEDVLNNKLMIVYENGEDKIYPYKDFDKVFTTWELPSIKQPLPLREYLFAHCQDYLAVKYELQISSSVPAKYYSHDLDEIDRQLNRILGIQFDEIFMSR
ncbi:hypothetical protein THRCLA_09422 [Thraustotheca clavata]|uniref:Uncharacterized protein n=1 Tax=Thraustotheca clavata TaxID=74557 RepID=A0A1V9YWH7_9STRA|nr:hypothetical protein THRCLA_09422 [Thraustotheca clavata]